MDGLAPLWLLTGMSAILAYWFLLAAVIFGRWTYRQKYTMGRWNKATPRARADVCLNVGMVLVLAHSGLQRILATWSFLQHEWNPTKVYTAPIYLTVALCGMSFLLWWTTYEAHGFRHRWWWGVHMFSGLAVGIVIAKFT